MHDFSNTVRLYGVYGSTSRSSVARLAICGHKQLKCKVFHMASIGETKVAPAKRLTLAEKREALKVLVNEARELASHQAKENTIFSDSFRGWRPGLNYVDAFLVNFAAFETKAARLLKQLKASGGNDAEAKQAAHALNDALKQANGLVQPIIAESIALAKDMPQRATQPATGDLSLTVPSAKEIGEQIARAATLLGNLNSENAHIEAQALIRTLQNTYFVLNQKPKLTAQEARLTRHIGEVLTQFAVVTSTLEGPERRAARELHEQDILRQQRIGAARFAGNAYLNGYDFKNALTAYEKADQDVQRDEYPTVWADVQADIALAHYHLMGNAANRAELEDHFQKALAGYQSALRVYTAEGDSSERISALKQAITRLQQGKASVGATLPK